MERKIFYDKKGYPSVYSDINNIIFKFDGEPLGYIHHNSIYKFDGIHLGFFFEDWVYDNNGKKVFFSTGADNSPPVKEIYPVIQPKKSIPMKLERNKKSEIPPLSNEWSNLSIKDFFTQ